MNLANNIAINIYSILLLIIICFHASKHTEKESLQNKLYKMMLYSNIVLLVVDILSRFDGKPDTIYSFINASGNLLEFMLSLILPSLWLLYVHSQVHREERETKQLLYSLCAINVINAVLSILSQFYGWFYYIDSDNIYHRGPLFLLPVFITVALIFVTFIIIVKNRKRIEKKYFLSLVFFPIPPLACIILQVTFYGMSLMLNSVVVSLLVILLNIQNRSIYTDYLTGVNNRKKLDTYLKKKISTSTEEKSFSAILIDLNNFKSINDTFGHDIGDNALEIAAKLIKSCLRQNDFIARYGGDEFCIVLDVSNRADLETMICRIYNCIEKYNESSSQPYKLGVSMGYDVYDYHSHMKAQEFQKKVDLLMYENKKFNKGIESKD
jgi:diguanylate cyclase (GGDEF)-like protein